MNEKKIRILIVDDSALIRELIRDSLKSHADLEVVGEAADGQDVLRMVETLRPDLITLDLQMPRIDGLTILGELMERCPLPVIVVSSLTQRSADVTMQALDRGAMDYIAKPEGISEMRRVFGHELPQKIRNMAGTDVRRVMQLRKARRLRSAAAPVKVDDATLAAYSRACIAIGISTGGPPALSTLFSLLVPPLPPIVIVQHMPPLFTGPFAKRLDALSSLSVKEAQPGDILCANMAYVAPGGKHLELVRIGTKVRVNIVDRDYVSGHRPSVDVMMKSAAAIYQKQCLGVIMTGMGRDGADGCGAIRNSGGFVLGQDGDSSDVYGMNKVAFIEGQVHLQVPLDDLAVAITRNTWRIVDFGKGTPLNGSARRPSLSR